MIDFEAINEGGFFNIVMIDTDNTDAEEQSYVALSYCKDPIVIVAYGSHAQKHSKYAMCTAFRNFRFTISEDTCKDYTDVRILHDSSLILASVKSKVKIIFVSNDNIFQAQSIMLRKNGHQAVKVNGTHGTILKELRMT